MYFLYHHIIRCAPIQAPPHTHTREREKRIHTHINKHADADQTKLTNNFDAVYNLPPIRHLSPIITRRTAGSILCSPRRSKADLTAQQASAAAAAAGAAAAPAAAKKAMPVSSRPLPEKPAATPPENSHPTPRRCSRSQQNHHRQPFSSPPSSQETKTHTPHHTQDTLVLAASAPKLKARHARQTRTRTRTRTSCQDPLGESCLYRVSTLHDFFFYRMTG